MSRPLDELVLTDRDHPPEPPRESSGRVVRAGLAAVALLAGVLLVTERSAAVLEPPSSSTDARPAGAPDGADRGDGQ